VGQQGLELGSGLGAEVSLKDFRKDVIIEVYNEAGQLAIAYKVYRCWVSEFTPCPNSTPAPTPSPSSPCPAKRRLGARLRRDRAERADRLSSRRKEIGRQGEGKIGGLPVAQVRAMLAISNLKSPVVTRWIADHDDATTLC
jgi:hypothetical protein